MLNDLMAHTIDDAGCRVWQRGCCNGHPAVRHAGRTTLVRRLIWERMHGPIPGGKIVRMTCETARCIEPEHMCLTTHKRLATELGALGVMSGPIRSARIAATKQRQSCLLTQGLVDEIRSSAETGVSLAARLGLSENLISKIRTHKTWRTLGPFSALVARFDTTRAAAAMANVAPGAGGGGR